MFTAFGEPVASVVEAGEPSAVSSRYGYVGAFGYEGLDANQPAGFDVLAEAGLLHVGARHYDPATGRFVERDPIGIRGGLITYEYAGSNPVSWTDPNGQGLLKWLYTGDWNADDETDRACVAAAGEKFYNDSPVRGGFVGVGAGGNRGLGAGGGVGWTVDEGALGYAGVGISDSTRGRGSNGRYASNTFAAGYGVTYGANGFSGTGGLCAGAAVSGGSQLELGINVGPLSIGIVVDPGRIR
jgi:RHS repeat-associated protein